MTDLSNKPSTQDQFIGENDGNQITDVVVFTDQAHVKRKAGIQVPEGANRLLMEVRAFMVDIDSAQAKVYGSGEILSVQYKEIPVKDAVQAEVRKLEEKKKELDQQRKALNSEKEILDKQKRFLDSVIGFAETDMPKEIKTRFPDPENLETMFNFLGENYKKLAEKDCTLKPKIDDLETECQVLEKKFKKCHRPNDRTQKVIEVLFDSNESQEISIEVSYVAEYASWEPVYKVDVSSDLSDVGLTMFARILQKTGENWKDVKLTVSNAVPLKGVSLPDLESWYIDMPPVNEPVLFAGAPPDAPAPSGKSKRKRPKKLKEEFVEEMAMLDDLSEPPEAEFIQAEQKEMPLAFEYGLPQKIDLNSGEGETILPLYTKEMQGKSFIYCVPRNDLLAYLACETTAGDELLAGRLNIHFSGRFVGGTALPEKKAGEDMFLNLGVDRGVKVRREKATDRISETLLGMVDRQSVVREFEYRIIVENLKDKDVVVHMIENIPVSKTDRIQVKGMEIKPEPSIRDYQKHEGLMLWDFVLKSKSTQEIRVKYIVKYPKGITPQGIDDMLS